MICSESTSAGLPTNIWGFDQLPTLPLAAEQVLGEYQQKGLFGPKGALRVVVQSFPPETGNQAPDLGPLMAKLDFGTGHNMTPGKIGRWDAPHRQHRPRGRDQRRRGMSYPDEDGELKEIQLKVGDFLVQNGNFHAVAQPLRRALRGFIVTLGAERKAT